MGKKVKGNGEGTLYINSKTNLYVGQYMYNGKRKSVYQKKNENKGEFKKRFNDILSSINHGLYIESNKISLNDILNEYIENKYNTGIISDRTYKRNLDNLKLLKKMLRNFYMQTYSKSYFNRYKKIITKFYRDRNKWNGIKTLFSKHNRQIIYAFK